MNEGLAHGGRVEASAETLRGALQGHYEVAGGNAPGRLTRKPSDPEGVVEARLKALCIVAASFSYDPFRVGRGEVASFRGRCPRLLYESPSGILRKHVPSVFSKKCGTCSVQSGGCRRREQALDLVEHTRRRPPLLFQDLLAALAQSLGSGAAAKQLQHGFG